MATTFFLLSNAVVITSIIDYLKPLKVNLEISLQLKGKGKKVKGLWWDGPEYILFITT